MRPEVFERTSGDVGSPKVFTSCTIHIYQKKKIFAFLGVKCSQNWQLSFLIIEKRIPTTPFSKSSSTLARLPMAHACRKPMMSPGAEFNLATRLVRW